MAGRKPRSLLRIYIEHFSFSSLKHIIFGWNILFEIYWRLKAVYIFNLGGLFFSVLKKY